MIEVFLELLLKFATFSFTILLGEAAKYFGRKFDWNIFFKTNIKPMIWTFIAGIVMSLTVLLPETYSMFITTLAGGKIDTINMESFYMTAGVLAVVLKSTFGKSKDEI